jgi:hypothetical protein
MLKRHKTVEPLQTEKSYFSLTSSIDQVKVKGPSQTVVVVDKSKVRQSRRRASTLIMLLMQMRSKKFDLNKLTTSEKELVKKYKGLRGEPLQKKIDELAAAFTL